MVVELSVNCLNWPVTNLHVLHLGRSSHPAASGNLLQTEDPFPLFQIIHSRCRFARLPPPLSARTVRSAEIYIPATYKSRQARHLCKTSTAVSPRFDTRFSNLRLERVPSWSTQDVDALYLTYPIGGINVALAVLKRDQLCAFTAHGREPPCSSLQANAPFEAPPPLQPFHHSPVSTLGPISTRIRSSPS